MIKGFRQIALLTTISRFLGLARDICYSHFFGANNLFDAWVIAFKIPNLSRRLFGEGAASASLIPVYSETLHKDKTTAAELANTVATVVFIILAGIVLAGEAAIWIYYKFAAQTNETQLILQLTSIMLPFMMFVCTMAILGGILNAHRHFAFPAAAPIVLNVFIIGSILLTGKLLKIEPREQLFWVALAVIIAGFAQMLMQFLPLKLYGVTIRPAWNVRSVYFKKILIMMAPMIIGLTVTQMNTLADDLIAWWFSGSQEKGLFFTFFGKVIQYPMQRGSVSHLYYAQRLYQLPLGVLGISLATAVFPVMSDNAAKGQLDALRSTIAKGLRGTIFIAIPATIGLILVAEPLISAAFEHGKFGVKDSQMVFYTLIFYSIGLCGYFAQQILTRAFYAMQDPKIPMKSALTAVTVNILLNLILIWFLGRMGLALATAICAYLQVIILSISLQKRLKESILTGLGKTALKTIIAAAIMTAIIILLIYLCRFLPQTRFSDILRLIITVPTAAGTYLIAAKLLKIEELSLLSSPKKAIKH